MPLRILICPDKFKGTLTADEAAQAIAAGWRSKRPGDRLELLPMTDGGDGFGLILGSLHVAETRIIDTIDAAHQPIQARWWFQPSTSLAIVEAAEVIGLARLPRNRFHPFELDTLGLAAVLEEAARSGASRCLIGIGGSATNDAGFGLACGLGWTFLDAGEEPITHWPRLARLHRIVPPVNLLPAGERVVAVDVDNPLLGIDGCSRVYGPQKGLAAQQAPAAEAALSRLEAVVRDQFGLDLADTPGAGAAGGLGYGLQVFAHATPASGFDLFAEAARLDARIAEADLVLTGEGSLDAQTFMGKGTGQVARRCQSRNVPCIGLAGRADPVPVTPGIHPLFSRVLGIAPSLAPPAQAMARPAFWLEKLAAQAAAGIEAGTPPT